MWAGGIRQEQWVDISGPPSHDSGQESHPSAILLNPTLLVDFTKSLTMMLTQKSIFIYTVDDYRLVHPSAHTVIHTFS